MKLLFWRKPPTVKPVALLIHGLSSSSNAWRYLAPQLVADGYEVFTPDLPGHGSSPRHEDYTVESMAESIKEQIGDANVDLLIGHSLGGLIATHLSQELKPRKLVLLDPVLHLPSTRLMKFGVRHFFHRNVVRDSRARDWDKPTEALADEHDRICYLNWDGKTVRALDSRPKLVKKVFGEANEESVLVVRTKNSYITPARIQKAYANKIRFHYLLGGHNIHIEQPDTIHALIQSFVGRKETLNQSLPFYRRVSFGFPTLVKFAV